MNAKIQERAELFDRNNKAIMKKFWLKDTRLQVLSGFMYTVAGREADVERLNECREILSRHFGILSSARDNLELPVMTSMALSDDPEAYAAKLKDLYDTVKKGSFFYGDYEMLSALILMDAPQEELPSAVERMKAVYSRMRDNHPWLTDASDKSSAALLTLSGKDEDALLDDMEACFKILKPEFKLQGNTVQTMSALLALQDGSPEAKCAKTVELCKKLKENGLSLNFSLALPLVAGLAAADGPADRIIEGVKEAAEALKGKSGFGLLGQGSEGRTIYGMLLYLTGLGETGSAAGAVLQRELLNVIIQEIIIIMIILMTTYTASQSSNS